MTRLKKKPAIIDGTECWLCSTCKEYKPTSEFTMVSRHTNGLCSWCRPCARIRNAASRSRPGQLKKTRAAARGWNSENQERYRENCQRWASENKDHLKKYDDACCKANPEKRKAKSAVARVIISGVLTRPEECEVCTGSRPLDAHHDSYDIDRWLVVTFMCKRCHRWTHARRTDQAAGIWE